jgi:hypothetical protein
MSAQFHFSYRKRERERDVKELRALVCTPVLIPFSNLTTYPTATCPLSQHPTPAHPRDSQYLGLNLHSIPTEKREE